MLIFKQLFTFLKRAILLLKFVHAFINWLSHLRSSSSKLYGVSLPLSLSLSPSLSLSLSLCIYINLTFYPFLICSSLSLWNLPILIYFYLCLSFLLLYLSLYTLLNHFFLMVYLSFSPFLYTSLFFLSLETERTRPD
jgi:hypothetical protein